MTLNSQIEFEKKMDMSNVETYKKFKKRITNAKNKTISFIKDEISKGKIIHGYAASTKGNTTLQYYNLDKNMLSVISDRNPDKWKKLTAGTNITIISEKESRDLKPDYYFILAWHFLDEFVKREAEFFENGGKFILSMPDFMIIDKNKSKLLRSKSD